MTTKRKFKITCQHEKDLGGGSVRDCQEEIIVELKDNTPNIDQESANALCRKLEQHFKEKHPQEKINEGKITVRQGDKVASLQEDGSISEKELMSPKTWRNCEKCSKNLVVFEDDSTESHYCSQNPNHTPRNQDGSDQSPNNNPNGFNWTPLLIGGSILAIILLGSLLFRKIKDN